MDLKRVLMVAYHFPPLAGSSGIQRTLRFVQQLPALGWQPLVLSADTRAYEYTSDDLLSELPPALPVRRAFALDTGRHLQIGGHHLLSMALPDRWQTWRHDGVRQGMQMIKEFKPDLIWSTYPIATAHLIGHGLAKRSGLPWVADFRDPMLHEGFPSHQARRDSFGRVEKLVFERARQVVVTTPGTQSLYRERFPHMSERISVLANGFDEDSFVVASQHSVPIDTRRDRPLVLLHSGVVYPSERDPTQLFQALARLQRAGRLSPDQLRLRFRGSLHDEVVRRCAMEQGALDFIELAEELPYKEALAEMMSVDGLLLLQAANCNLQIPAKFYEYLRAGRPVLGLTDLQGDTANVLRSAGFETVLPLDQADVIEAELPAWLDRLREGTLRMPDARTIMQASRISRTHELAALFDGLLQR